MATIQHSTLWFQLDGDGSSSMRSEPIDSFYIRFYRPFVASTELHDPVLISKGDSNEQIKSDMPIFLRSGAFSYHLTFIIIRNGSLDDGRTSRCPCFTANHQALEGSGDEQTL